MTPEGRPANELLVNAEAPTQRGLNNGSVEGEEEEEEEEQRVLRETNHHTRGLLETRGTRVELKNILWEEKSMQHTHHKILV